MNQLENVTRIEYRHLKAVKLRIIGDTMLSLARKDVRFAGLSSYEFEYLPRARKVVLFKPRETALRYAKSEMVAVDNPNAAEEELLVTAQKYLERYRRKY